MERVAVGLGIDRDRLDPHPAGGLDDPAGDLAAIGDQNLLEHLVVYDLWAGLARDPPKCERFGDKITRQSKLERARTQNRYPLLLVALHLQSGMRARTCQLR